MINIIVVEDDKDLQEMFCITLNNQSYTFFQQTMKKSYGIYYEKIDLAIIDMMMPKINGFELTQEIRNINKELPILMITSRSDYTSL